METDNNPFDYKHFAELRERSIGRLIWRMKRHSDNFIEPKLHAAGFTDFKMSYLMFLANIEEMGITNNELAKRACVTKQMMSKTVSLLEAEGYISIHKSETDSRSSMIFLSDRGKQLFTTLVSCMAESRARMDAIVGHDRIETIIDTMIELTTELDKEPM
jgi:DNA-binding MarR family transcriptional regulator